MTRVAATVVYLNAPRSVELRTETLDSDRLLPTEVLCETIVTAISPGTELAAYQGLPPLRAGVVYPRLQGYCNVARVLGIGSSVSGLHAGDRVLTFSSHRSHFVISQDDVLLRIDDKAQADDVVCAYLYHLGYNSVLRAGVRAGSQVLVIGLGALGLTSIAMAAVAGAKVIGLSNQQSSHRIAQSLGAVAVFSRSDLERARAALSEGLADVVINTSNAWADWEIALMLAGHFGTIASLGFPGRGEPAGSFNPLDSRYFYAKQLRIEAVGLSPEKRDSRRFLRFNERDNLRYLADLIAAGRLNPSLLVSGAYAGGDIERAYLDLLARKNDPITYLLRWQ